VVGGQQQDLRGDHPSAGDGVDEGEVSGQVLDERLEEGPREIIALRRAPSVHRRGIDGQELVQPLPRGIELDRDVPVPGDPHRPARLAPVLAPDRFLGGVDPDDDVRPVRDHVAVEREHFVGEEREPRERRHHAEARGPLVELRPELPRFALGGAPVERAAVAVRGGQVASLRAGLRPRLRGERPDEDRIEDRSRRGAQEGGHRAVPGPREQPHVVRMGHDVPPRPGRPDVEPSFPLRRLRRVQELHRAGALRDGRHPMTHRRGRDYHPEFPPSESTMSGSFQGNSDRLSSSVAAPEHRRLPPGTGDALPAQHPPDRFQQYL